MIQFIEDYIVLVGRRVGISCEADETGGASEHENVLRMT
jgi:hypothetical protein